MNSFISKAFILKIYWVEGGTSLALQAEWAPNVQSVDLVVTYIGLIDG